MSAMPPNNLTPGENLEQILNDLSSREATFNSKYWDTSERRKAGREWHSIRNYGKQALADFIEGEMKGVIGENMPTEGLYPPDLEIAIDQNTIRDLIKKRLESWLREVRS